MSGRDNAFDDGSKPVEVTMPGWSVFTLQSNAPIDVSGYTTLTVVVNGGKEGKQEFTLTAKLGEKVVSEAIVLKCKKGEWGRFDIPLKKLKLKGAQIDSLVLNNGSGDPLSPFYLNYVLFQ